MGYPDQRLRVALVSLDATWEAKGHNFERCADFVAEAAGAECDLVIFPEMTLTGFSMNVSALAEDPANSETIGRFSVLAERHGLHIIVGVILKQEAKGVNTLVLVGPKGATRATYAKTHPFSYADEHLHYERGTEVVTSRIGDFVFGFSICYDLRFPELYTALQPGCDVLVNIANWPKRRLQQWQTLLGARAIENQAYVIGVNRIGVDGNGLEYEKSSQVIAADGESLDPIAYGTELDVYELDKKALEHYRASFPTLQDRNADLHRKLL